MYAIRSYYAKRELKLKSKQLEQARDAIDTSHERALSLISEAKAVGVIANDNIGLNPDGIIEVLRESLHWQPEKTPDDDGNQIASLEEELVLLRKERRAVKDRINATRQFSKQAGA